MCGIFGAAGRELDAQALDPARAFELMGHRGPDGRGFWRGTGVALGHLRLAIIDLSERGAQPMHGVSGDVALTYNGEIYNFQALRDELAAMGVRFRSSSDTEVLLEAYRAWGLDAFRRLNGMFAFALYDAEKRELVLCRDSVGIKPLYFAQDANGSLHFASEVKALPPEITADVEFNRLIEYLYFGAVHGGKTLRRGVHSLEPGSYLIFKIDTNQIETKRYWWPGERVETDRAGATRSTTANARVLRDLLIDAVGRQLVSDRKVGVFLSGGVDSSAIACIAASSHDRKLDTFTARFKHASSDTDLRFAAELSRMIGCRHQVVDVDLQVDLPLIDRVLRHFDGPFPDAAAIPLMLMSDALPKDVKVVLQGDGGDELFGGYPRYRYIKYRRFLQGLPLGTGALLSSALRSFSPVLSPRLRRMALALSEKDLAVAIARFLTVEYPESPFAPERMVSAEVPVGPAFDFHRQAAHEALRRSDVGKALDVDLRTILPDYFLEKVDRATMAASIEVRVPFLDQELIDFATSLPAADLLPGGRQKGLLRMALTGIVPDFILNAKKRGFGTPYGEWIRTMLEQDVRAELQQSAVFDRSLALRMLDLHVRREEDHSFMLWKMFLFSRWLRTRVPPVACDP